MQPDHAGSIRGLGTAVFVLSIIGLVGCALGLVGLVIGSGFSLFAEPIKLLSGQVGISGVLVDAVGGTLGFLGALFSLAFSAGVSIFCLYAGDTIRKNAEFLSEYDRLFKLAIIGIVVTLIFGGGPVMTVLFIIMAVFIYQDRKALMG